MLIVIGVNCLWQGLSMFSEMTFSSSLSFYIESIYSYLPKGKGMNNTCDPVSPRWEDMIPVVVEGCFWEWQTDGQRKKEKEREWGGKEGRKEKGKKEKKTVCASLDKSVHPGVRRAWWSNMPKYTLSFLVGDGLKFLPIFHVFIWH